MTDRIAVFVCCVLPAFSCCEPELTGLPGVVEGAVPFEPGATVLVLLLHASSA